jgi:hypothetical protein
MRTGEDRSAYVPSSWREHAESQIAKASVLPPAKTSWSPSPPSQRTVARAYALVKAIGQNDLFVPITSASPDGVLCLEWRQPDRKLVFSIFEDGVVEYYLSVPCVEGELPDGLEKANEVVEMFLHRR